MPKASQELFAPGVMLVSLSGTVKAACVSEAALYKISREMPLFCRCVSEARRIKGSNQSIGPKAIQLRSDKDGCW